MGRAWKGLQHGYRTVGLIVYGFYTAWSRRGIGNSKPGFFGFSYMVVLTGSLDIFCLLETFTHGGNDGWVVWDRGHGVLVIGLGKFWKT